MSITDELDSDALISRLAGPLSPPDRIAFRRAAEDALARVPCWGEGAVYRAVAGLQKAFAPLLAFNATEAVAQYASSLQKAA